VNLISNAIKYSATKDEPQIEIAAYSKDGEHVFYVKDNGVGFDQQYSDKLFKVFQRLHSQEEFEGTGIGLALVEKILTKQGGRVWAEAELGKGACFYFSLPE
jgi:light-regulated signal transduction histidine kinase (bacteriophytochrome)